MGKIVPFHDCKDCDPFRDPTTVVVERLVKAFGYTRGAGIFLAEGIRELHPSLHDAFLRYWNTKQRDESLFVGGIRLCDAIRLCDDVFQAFFWLDAMHKSPRETTARWSRALMAVGQRKSGVVERWTSYTSPQAPKLPKW